MKKSILVQKKNDKLVFSYQHINNYFEPETTRDELIYYLIKLLNGDNREQLYNRLPDGDTYCLFKNGKLHNVQNQVGDLFTQKKLF